MHDRIALLLALALPVAAAAQDPSPSVRVSGSLETYYSWNFADPDNGINHFRGFDNRHATFTLSNAMLDVVGESGALTAHVGLQVGHTPNTYYLAEPRFAATAGTGGSDPETWRWLQQANVGWRAAPSNARAWLVEAGLFLSPIGPEGIAVRDNWNWSRSNLFFALPFYHTGARASIAVSPSLRLTGAAYNGWNSVTDNNDTPSGSVQLQHTSERFTGSALYFGGVERAKGAPEGDPWRHLFDAWLQWNASERIAFLVHGDAGFEETVFGTADWRAAAASTRIRLHPKLHLALRGDVFREELARDAMGTSSPIFWGTADADGIARVASGTVGIDYRPETQLSLRAEWRYDDANVNLYFDRPDPTAPLPDVHIQRTATLGAAVWF